VLVDVLDKGWKAFEKKDDGYPCPWDLKLIFLGPFDDATT
jgi:hypothetical protein